MQYKIGIDIGGTSAKIGVVDSDYNVVATEKIKTTLTRTADEIIGDIAEVCKGFMTQFNVVSAGIGSAGRIDSKNGVVLRAGNLPFSNEPITKKLSSFIGLPVNIQNDGSCALIGEHLAGVCRGFDDCIILTLGTGVGGAIMIGGKIYDGHNGIAGELGHITIDLTGKKCECGLYGCYEKYASARALIGYTEQYARENPDSILAKEVQQGTDGRTVFNALGKGCPVADEVLRHYGRLLAIGINNYVKIFQPQMIAISGGISNEGEGLLSYVRPHLLPEANVKASTLKGLGGLIGASSL